MIDETRDNKAVIAVVVPSYKVKRHILEVLAAIGPEIARIYVVDDACPEGSGDHVRAHCTDPRVTVVALPENRGVGGATLGNCATGRLVIPSPPRNTMMIATTMASAGLFRMFLNMTSVRGATRRLDAIGYSA